MKKILLLLILVPLMAISQTIPADATALENLQITNNTTSPTAPFVTVQETNGVMNKINKADLVNVVEVNDVPSLPLIGEVGKIYVVKNVNKIYRWNGTFYQELSGSDLNYQSVIDALTFTPENVVNKVTDIATGANNITYPTSLAVKTYADNLVVGMLNDRGSWDASVNLFPTTGGSGAAGAIRKGDMWYVSIAGTLGGKSVNVGDSFRALVNAPAQIDSNWSVLESNIGYIPEKESNKTSSYLSNSAISYTSSEALFNGLATKEPIISPKNTAFNKNFGTTAGTVAEGNDSRILNGQTAFSWGNHAGRYPTYSGTGATGTWDINITGNAGSATNWGNLSADFNTNGFNPNDLIGYDNSDGKVKPFTFETIKTKLGLGTNAYSSTAYLPLSGGTVSGTITASPATVDTQLATWGQAKAVARPYKVYTALLSQSGTNAPVVIGLDNSLGANISWARIGTGTYSATISAGNFTGNRTYLNFQITTSAVSEPRIIAPSISGTSNSFTFYTYGASSLNDGVLNTTPVEIRIYP